MQGLIGGFVGGDPSALSARRVGDPFAALVATLSPRVWIDAHGGTHLTLSGLNIDSATDRSGSGNHATMSGGNRPSYDPTAFGGRGGMLFAAPTLQRLVTPPFAMGARSSGAIVWRPTGDNQTAFEFGATFDQHGYLLCSGGGVRLRRAPAGGEVNIATTYPQQWRVIWRMDDTGVRALFNGAVRTLGAAAGKPPALTAPLYLGAIQGGVTFSLDGHIGELVFADAVWTDAEMNAVDAAMAARWS